MGWLPFPIGASVVLVTGDPGSPCAATAHAAEAEGARVVVDDGTFAEDELRLRLAEAGGAGRPDLVLVLDGDLARAARRVRRGGSLCALGATVVSVPLAALVQRELAVLTPDDLPETIVAAALGARDGGPA